MKADNLHPVVLFDGVCNLCEKTVRWIVRNDSSGDFVFASLQSAAAQALLQRAQYQHVPMSSVLVMIDGEVYRKSRAALQICKRLDGAWPMLYYLFALIPAGLADKIYDYIGARRYRWFGRKNECWIPSPEVAARFVDALPVKGSRHRCRTTR
jgi:predicted DCC family thiol-disulfide oxidoreductase YuxK